MNSAQQSRNSSIELLKVIAVIMIVFSHAIPVPIGGGISDYVMNLDIATTNIQRFIIVLFKYGGSFGNDIFIISSAWFLLDSKKASGKKVFLMLADCFIISILFLFVFLLCGYNLSGREIIMQFMPTWMRLNWFIGCYLLFYLIHPLLNIIISNLSQEKMLTTTLSMIILYCGFNFLYSGSFFYSELIGFICIYFIVAYAKLYLKSFSKSKKANIVALSLGILLNLILIIATNFLGLYTEAFSDKLLAWNSFMNPLNILAVLAMFNLVSQYQFVNKKINYLSSLSMLIYVTHSNDLVMKHLVGDVYKYIYNTFTYKFELMWVILFAIVLLISSTILSSIYKFTLQKICHKLCERIYARLSTFCQTLIAFLLR